MAVVVPDVAQLFLRTALFTSDTALDKAKVLSDTSAIQALCKAKDAEIAEVLLRELQSLARFRSLRAHETVAHVLVATPAADPVDPTAGIGWSALNGSLTPSLKLNRFWVLSLSSHLLCRVPSAERLWLFKC